MSREKPDKLFLNALLEFISEPIKQKPTELRRAFREEGLDYDRLAQEGLDLIHSFEREQRFTKAKENRHILLKLIEDVKIDRYKGRRQDLVTAFKKIFSPGKPNLAFFHKLESVDDNELQEMLNEATILEIFEKQLQKKKE